VAKSSKSSSSRPRELLVVSKNDKRYIRRNSKGQFTDDQVDVGRSLAKDVRQRAQKVIPKGQGDKGDQRRGGRG